ncbi:MAG TPA: DUF1549 and DUF1553 domain-containing protein [Tepidisphaeraceae bacterium]|nr:DUF1549 and DUF1553 domain-containing protein [Tepidisphaeraceae bacterium]
MGSRRFLIVCTAALLAWSASRAIRADADADSGGAKLLHLDASKAGPYDYAAARKLWAFQKPVEPAIPAVRDSKWCKSPIDDFVLAKLESQGLKPAAQADKITLIRRATYDLTGLPPLPEDVDRFVHDDSPDAFAKVIDRLLASPAYGQNWARHWLDVVRYTDAFDSRSVKGDVIGDGDVSNAWRYRDWVVKAFNQDLPYDQFVINQIAGDLLPGPKGETNFDGITATGMYVIGNWGPGDADKEKMLTDIVDDQIDVTGRAFLGLTLACARCHDHKFDPIPTADYYGLAGIFFSSHILPDPGQKTAGSLVAKVSLDSVKDTQERAAHEKRIVDAKDKIEKLLDEAYLMKIKVMLPRLDEYLMALRKLELAQGKSKDLPGLATKDHLDPISLERMDDYVDRQLHPQRQRKLLTTARDNVSGLTGVSAWTGPTDMPPSVTVNTTSEAVSFSTISLPARSLAVHPGPQSGVAIGWRSPIQGVVRVSGEVIDADPTCGNGIDWSLDLIPTRGMQRLASGTFTNGGRQRFASGRQDEDLDAVTVNKGDVIRLTVFPKGDYSCDTTTVELKIEEPTHKLIWNLKDDVLDDFHAGNPHSDRMGHSAVWEFGEVPDELPGNVTASDIASSTWDDLFGSSEDDAQNAAESMRDVLKLIDQQAQRNQKTGKGKPLNLKGSNAILYRALSDPRGAFWADSRAKDDNLPVSEHKQVAQARDHLASLEKRQFPPIAYANAIQEGGTPQSVYAGFHDTKIEIRGRYDQLGESVPRHLPRLLAGDEQPAITSGSGRMQLAQWIASKDNPLTARVMVNRIWQHHFGTGIVPTENNFGKLGVAPTHPALLDYLACEFMKNGWSIKAMQRMIMLSATYQQSSNPDPQTLKVDPGNELLGCMPRQRLSAESIRDSLLMDAGRLDTALGGAPTREISSHRRSIYLMSIRSERSDYRTLFDAPDPNAIVDGRIDSTVAPQALFLMDDPFVLSQAKAIADRALSEPSGDDAKRIEWLYRHLYSRMPSHKEIAIGLNAIKGEQESIDGAPAMSKQDAWTAYCQVLLCANEFVYVD